MRVRVLGLGMARSGFEKSCSALYFLRGIQAGDGWHTGTANCRKVVGP